MDQQASGHPSPTTAIAPDCRHYTGDKPCVHHRLCAGCVHYAPWAQRICVIKLGALGDVTRTLCVLPELHRQFPDAHITWITKPAGKRMIEHHPQIDRVLVFDAFSITQLQQERFDLVISLDKEPQPCGFATSLRADRKLGIGLSDYGTPAAFNAEAERYLQLGLCDDLKFQHNRNSYAHLVFDALGWTYRGQSYELRLLDVARDTVGTYLDQHGHRDDMITVGINVGSGTTIANKMWPAERIVELIVELRGRDSNLQIVLLGGTAEQSTIDRILDALARLRLTTGIIDGGAEHDEQAFLALIDRMDVVFCGDTMAMHAAIARGRQVVAVFEPTCEQEINLFGRGEKLIAATPCSPCSPCYKRQCDQGDVCVTGTPVAIAADAIERAIHRTSDHSYTLPVIPQRKAG